MDTLTNKKFAKYDYTSRYLDVPYYFDTLAKRELYGIGSNMLKNSPWVAHKVRPEDTLEALALKYYNNPTFWWIIAYFNDIIDVFAELTATFDILKIPNISSISFGAER